MMTAATAGAMLKGFAFGGVMHGLANPARFRRISEALSPWLWTGAALSCAIGLILAFRAPADYQQGEAYRIMFVHVPAAWSALFTYLLLASAGGAHLIWRHPLAAVAGKALAPIGAAFTAIALFTGAVWGKPMWGTYWVWDARLTSVLILFFFYVGHIALSNAFDDARRGAQAASILALVGVVNLPIVKFSVDWWNSLHQPASILRFDGPTMHISMLIPLLVMALAFKLLLGALAVTYMRAELAAARVEAMRARGAAAI